MQFVIISGMSGAGKSKAASDLEDLGFYCVDNMPAEMIPQFAQLCLATKGRYEKVALVTDVRASMTFDALFQALQKLDEMHLQYSIYYIEASTEVIIKRYKETRRNHPLSGGDRVDKGIEEERKRLAFLKESADYIIDTSQLLTRELKAELDKIFVQNQDYKNLFITILSFGFKYGIPADSDLVFDVRFLPNPYYVEGLRAKTGNDKEIQDYVFQYEEAHTFLDKLEDMLNFLIPNYIAEGKNQLVISIGCTGGKHRSVTLANALYERLSGQKGYGLKIEHRDIGKDALRGK